MLTESETQWLRDRELSPNPYCGWCMKYALCCSPLYNKCPTKTADLNDALEFSERVAATLALGCGSQTPCYGCWRTHWKICNLRKGYWDCADCFLKVARLKVEEEIDK